MKKQGSLRTIKVILGGIEYTFVLMSELNVIRTILFAVHLLEHRSIETIVQVYRFIVAGRYQVFAIVGEIDGVDILVLHVGGG